MFEAPSFADLNLAVTLPALFLMLFSTVLLIVDLFIPNDNKIRTAQLAIGAIVVTFILNLFAFDAHELAVFDMFIADPLTGFINVVVLVAALISILLSIDYLKRARIKGGEYYTLMLFSVLGIMFMATANDLIVVFVALELLSIPLYVLSAIRPKDARSEESGMKYFILGAFASAFFVYGSALVYGATGSTNLPEIFAAVETIVATDSTAQLYLLVGTAMIIVGLGFKVAVVPFHMWTPDVYDGAPTPVTAFMSVGAKAGGFAALLRIMSIGLPAFALDSGDTVAAWQVTVAVVAALTMVLGNFVAIAQTNIKRMLAYSSIAHAGYILMAVAAIGTLGVAEDAVRGALVYLLAYAFTNLGAFAVALSLEKEDGTAASLDDFNGLSRSKPLMAMMMAFFMLSLTGIPMTGGFIGKFMVFGATVEAGLTWLAVIGALTSVVSAFYYVRVIINMYLNEGEGDPATGATNYVTAAVFTAFSGTLLIGIFPALATGLLDTLTIAATTIAGS